MYAVINSPLPFYINMKLLKNVLKEEFMYQQI